MKHKVKIDRIRYKRIPLLTVTQQEIELLNVPLRLDPIELKKARCRLLVIYPDGQYKCLAYGKIKTLKVCNTCPNPCHRVMSFVIS
ncbi:MAG: hypothetical protein ACFE95_07780 [Candidatus Hodarchaeota archaeon]